MAAGTTAQISAAHQKNKAIGRAALADVQRKEQTAKEAREIFNEQVPLSNADKAMSDADTAAVEDLAATQGLINRPDTGFSGPSVEMQKASPVVKDAAAKSLAGELQRAESQLKARAALAGMQRRNRDRTLQQSRATEQLMQLGGFNRGWDQVAQVQNAAAQTAGGNTAMLGDLLVGLGGMGLMASGAGLGKAATAAPEAGSGLGLKIGSSLEQPLTMTTAPGSSLGLKAPPRWGGSLAGGISYGLR